MSDILVAILLGIVEGITEFLPVSSTGHLILATELMGYDAARWAVFNIAIQPGAILAIVVLYWRTFVAVGRPAATDCHYPDIDMHLFDGRGFRRKDGSAF